MDVRSFYLNFEIHMLRYGSQITNKLRAIQLGYINDSMLLNFEQCRRTSVAASVNKGRAIEPERRHLADF